MTVTLTPPAAPMTSSRSQCRAAPHRYLGDPVHRRPTRLHLQVSVSMMTIAVVAFCLVSVFLQPVAASSVFVGPGGFIINAPLSLDGVDVGSALTQLNTRLEELTTTINYQATRIASLESELAVTNAIVADQQRTIAELTDEVTNINSTVTDISDLVGETTIVVVVNGLRRITSQLSSAVIVLEGTVANQSAALVALTSDLTSVESLTGDSTLVSMVTSLSSDLTSLTSTVASIAGLTGSSTIVSTVAGIIDSMADQATDLSTLQTLETATTQMLTTLSQTVTSQVTIINSKMDAADATLQAQITQLQKWNVTVNSRVDDLGVRATDDETLIAGLQTLTTTLQTWNVTTNKRIDDLASLTAEEVAELQTRATDDEALITALQTRATEDESSISTNAAAITALQTRATDDETSISTNAAAITTLQSRATDDETSIATNAAAITTLQSRATDDETSIATNAAAITALQTRATTDEGYITALQTLTAEHTTEIAALQSAASTTTSTDVGGIGSYGFFMLSGSASWSSGPHGLPGTLISGSNLLWTDARGDTNSASAASPDGTWQVMGYTIDMDGAASNSNTLCVRIA